MWFDYNDFLKIWFPKIKIIHYLCRCKKINTLYKNIIPLMKIIALEEHTMDRAIGAAANTLLNENVPYLEAFFRPNQAASPTLQMLEMGATRLAEMDRCGIDMEVMSITNNTQWLKGSEAVTLARQANDRLATLVSEHPDRFRFFATLPWDNPQVAADELRRAVNELGAVGTLIAGRPNIDATFLDDRKYDPVWEALTSLDLPIYIHPGFPCREIADTYYTGFSDTINMRLYTWGFGWHLEAGIQVLRMVLAGVFERFPTLKVISGHWGELMPYYLARFDQALAPDVTGLPEQISTYFKRNVWVTPSGIYDYDDLDFCIRKLGIDHILFAADYPYIPEEGGRPFIEQAPLSQEDKEKIGFGNAAALMHL